MPNDAGALDDSDLHKAPPLTFALLYARAGYPVFPVKPRGKIPLTTRGCHDASRDETVINAWWKRVPDANIGLPLKDLVAVDIDPRNGGDADSLPGHLPDTCYAKTGGGGWHYLYRARDGAKYPGQVAPGVDVKAGAGAYIVVEPSVTTDKYVWLDESEPWNVKPTEAPDWIERVNGSPREPVAVASNAIREGGRNAHLTSLAGSMRRRGMAPDSIAAALLAENASRCMPALPDDEVRTIAASVGRYEPTTSGNEPRDWPSPIDLVALAQRDPAQPKSIMEGLPIGYATGTFGHGGAGKSQIELMRAVCIAAGVPFCGTPCERRRVTFVSCEDRADVLDWRLKRICRYLGVDLASLRDWLFVLDLVGHDCLLFAPDGRDAAGLTAAYGRLDEHMRRTATEVLVLDGISDTYGGNENARGEVKRFVNWIIGLVPPQTGATVLIGHVDKNTARSNNTAEGYSGSTAWHNSVRSRWYLYPEVEQDDDGRTIQRTGRLMFELQKANLGEVGLQIEFAWDPEAHLFVGRQVGKSRFDLNHQRRDEHRGILRAFAGAAKDSVVIPTALTGQRTAYHVLAVQPAFPETLKGGKKEKTRRFWRHIEELRQLRAIEESSYRRTNRHIAACFVLTPEGTRQCVE